MAFNSTTPVRNSFSIFVLPCLPSPQKKNREQKKKKKNRGKSKGNSMIKGKTLFMNSIASIISVRMKSIREWFHVLPREGCDPVFLGKILKFRNCAPVSFNSVVPLFFTGWLWIIDAREEMLLCISWTRLRGTRNWIKGTIIYGMGGALTYTHTYIHTRWHNRVVRLRRRELQQETLLAGYVKKLIKGSCARE